MDFFDLHCDTVSRLLAEGGSLADAPFHIDLQKARFDRWAQVFALFIDDSKGPDAAYELYRQEAACFFQQMEMNSDRIRQCRTAADLDAAFAAGKHAAILSVENGAALGGKLERLAEFQRDGVRLLTLTWFGENELGFGSMAGGPLKPFGREVLAALPRYGIVPDISHLSDEGVAEVFALYEGPLAATHSDVRKVTGHCRNLTEAQIREVSRRGGLIGLNLCRMFLSANAESAGCEDVYRHLSALLELGAERTVCFGTDFDGTDVPADIADLAGIPHVYEYLLQKGVAEATLRRVFFENARDFWRQVF